MEIAAYFDGIRIEVELYDDNEKHSLDFDGNFLIEIDSDLELTGNGIDGYGRPINPFNYKFEIKILKA